MRPVHVLAVVAALGVATPLYAEPVRLDEASLDRVTAGSRLPGVWFDINVFKNVFANSSKFVNIAARVQSAPRIRGNLAEAEASANAVGRNSFSQTLTAADVVSGKYSASFSESVAASSRSAKARIRR